MANLHEVPDLPIVVIAKVGPGETADDQRKKAVAAMPAVVASWQPDTEGFSAGGGPATRRAGVR